MICLFPLLSEVPSSFFYQHFARWTTTTALLFYSEEGITQDWGKSYRKAQLMEKAVN
jgi:hypothetical protein